MKENNKKFNLKEILQDKQKRAILILGIYFIFFLVLTISIRTSYKKPQTDNTADIINSGFAPEKINLNTYDFDYKIMKEGILYTYTGSYDGNIQQFTFENNEYYKENNIFYKKSNDKWEEVQSPYIYEEYLDFVNLNEILSKSEYNATTNFKDGSNAIIYNMYLNESITDNTITVTSKDNILSKIEINIDKDYLILEFTNQDKVNPINIKTSTEE